MSELVIFSTQKVYDLMVCWDLVDKIVALLLNFEVLGCIKHGSLWTMNRGHLPELDNEPSFPTLDCN